MLRLYRESLKLDPAAFAKSLGIAESTLRSLENGNRTITAERAVEIEERTKGGLTRHQLRPDIFDPPRKKAAAR